MSAHRYFDHLIIKGCLIVEIHTVNLTIRNHTYLSLLGTGCFHERIQE